MNQMCIEGVMYHPTFLYESVWNILVFIFLLILRRRNPLRGEVFLSYLMAYSVGRFFIEGMRTDSLYVPGTGIRMAQLISIIIVLAVIAIIWYRRKSGMATKHYDGKKVKKNKK
jgi:phosphatidylglycerol:prolipoprotein diacylglycerol transferase